MTQTRPRRVITRPLPTRVPPNRQIRKKLNSNYAYSPRTNVRKSNANLNQNVQAKSQHSQLLAAYGVNEKPKNVQKKRDNNNWISYLNDTTYTSQCSSSSPNLITPPAASLLFPSPTSPVTRTPEILRQIIDDSGFKILRESPLSAKDSYYAKDISDSTSSKNQNNYENQISKPYTSRYLNNTNKINDIAKSNTAKNERKQYPVQQSNTKDSLNANSNLNTDSKSSSSHNDKSSGRTNLMDADFEKEMENQQKKKADLEKLLDLPDFDLDKFDDKKLDSNDDIEMSDLNIDDLKIDLDDENEKIAKSSSIESNLREHKIEPNTNSNLTTTENTLSNSKQKVKLPTGQPANQSRNLDAKKVSFKLNQTATSQSNQASLKTQEDKAEVKPEAQQKTQKGVNIINDLNSPKTVNHNSNTLSSKYDKGNKQDIKNSSDGQQMKKKPDLDNLFDLADFNLDKFDDINLDPMDVIEIDDIKADLDDKDEIKTKPSTMPNLGQPSSRPNKDSNETNWQNSTQKVKLPTEQPTNQSRNLNKTATPQISQPQKDRTTTSTEVQQAKQNINSSINNQISPKTANLPSKISPPSDIKVNVEQNKAKEPSYQRESDSQRRRGADCEKLFELPNNKSTKPKHGSENATASEVSTEYDDQTENMDNNKSITKNAAGTKKIEETEYEEDYEYEEENEYEGSTKNKVRSGYEGNTKSKVNIEYEDEAEYEEDIEYEEETKNKNIPKNEARIENKNIPKNEARIENKNIPKNEVRIANKENSKNERDVEYEDGEYEEESEYEEDTKNKASINHENIPKSAIKNEVRTEHEDVTEYEEETEYEEDTKSKVAADNKNAAKNEVRTENKNIVKNERNVEYEYVSEYEEESEHEEATKNKAAAEQGKITRNEVNAKNPENTRNMANTVNKENARNKRNIEYSKIARNEDNSKNTENTRNAEYEDYTEYEEETDYEEDTRGKAVVVNEKVTKNGTSAKSEVNDEYEYEEETEYEEDVRPNNNSKENNKINSVPKVALPTEQRTNPARNLNVNKVGLNLNQTAIPLISQDPNSPQTISYYSIPDSKITPKTYTKIDQSDDLDDDSGYYSTSAACEMSDDPYTVNIFGDMSSFLHSEKNRNSKANSRRFDFDSSETTSQNSEENDHDQLKRSTENSSAFSTNLRSKSPLRSSFKADYEDEEDKQNSTRSVKFVLPK